MRLAVDAHAVGRHLTGNETYVRNLLRAFAETDFESEFFAYVSSPEAEALIPERFHVRRVSANPWVRLGWDLARAVRADQADVLHIQYTEPLGNRVPTVVTVHDVSFLDFPDFFTTGRRQQLRLTVAATVRRAAKIITVSNFSRDSILRAYDIDPGKIHVIPNAAHADFRPIGNERARKAAASRLSTDDPFVLSVGDLQPRKNHIGLIQGFSQFAAANPRLRHHLVLAGKDTWFAPKVHEAARQSGFASRIHFTGFVPDAELLELYNACDCFAFPSFYEGFGIPILEAMACGRPVVCSDTAAMPEVADGAALFFDPNDPASIAQSLADLLLDAEHRERIGRLGLKRAAQFSWQASARATLSVYHEAAGESAERRHAAAAVLAGTHPKP